MLDGEFLLLIIGMGLVTYIPRWLPLFALARRRLPGWFIEWLDLIPAAILSALLLPVLVASGEPRHIVLWHPELLVALPAFLCAFLTRSMGATVILGMFLFWLAGRIM